jgi:predicted glutamine amidotransferase
MHNGLVREFPQVKRDLLLAIDERLFPSIEGSADSEVLFYLALTFGLEEDPPTAVARTVGFVEETGRRFGVEHPIQMTIATTNGTDLWGFRYSSEGRSRSLYFSTDIRTIREQHPEILALQQVSEESRVVVSEPLGDRKGVWNEVPESSYGVIQEGDDELHPFQPIAP